MAANASLADENRAAANRGGLLTEEQQHTLARAVRAETFQGLLGVGCFVVLAGLIFFAALGSDDPTAGSAVVLFGGLLALLLVLMAALFWRRAQRLREVQAGVLERASGHVEFKNGRYRAEVPGSSLDLSAFNLAAGTYDFSFLPRSRRVVAAELAAADTPAQADDLLRHALAVTNHFNLDDLPAYRQGQQGPGMFRRLRGLWSTAGWLLLLSFVLAILFTIMVAGNVAQDFAAFVILPAIFLFIWAFFSVLGDIGPTLDILQGKVLSVRGDATKYTRVTHGRYATTFFYYSVEGKNWLVSAEAYRALIAGRRYRLYYLPHSKKLVGIEPLDEG